MRGVRDRRAAATEITRSLITVDGEGRAWQEGRNAARLARSVCGNCCETRRLHGEADWKLTADWKRALFEYLVRVDN